MGDCYQVFKVNHWEIRLCSHGRLIFLKAKGLPGVKVEKLGEQKKKLSSHGRVLFPADLKVLKGVEAYIHGCKVLSNSLSSRFKT